MRRLSIVLVLLVACSSPSYTLGEADFGMVEMVRGWQAEHPPSFVETLDDAELAGLGRRTCESLMNGLSVSHYMLAAGRAYGEEGLAGAWAVLAAASLTQCEEHFVAVSEAFDLMRRGGGVKALHK